MSGAAARTGDLKRKEEEGIIKRKWQVDQRRLKKNHCTRENKIIRMIIGEGKRIQQKYHD